MTDMKRWGKFFSCETQIFKSKNNCFFVRERKREGKLKKKKKRMNKIFSSAKAYL